MIWNKTESNKNQTAIQIKFTYKGLMLHGLVFYGQKWAC